MRKRIIGGIAAGAGATAVIGGLVLGTPSGASTTTWHHLVKPEAVDAVPAGALVEGEQQLVGAAGAGSYTIQRVGDHLTIVAVAPNAGWRVDVLHNDSDFVKAVFTSATTRVFAAARLGEDGLVDVAAFQDALPVPEVVKAAPPVKVAAAAAADDDHDGWCDHDGDVRSAGFGDRDDRGGWDGHHRHHRGGDDGWHDS